MLWLRVTSVVVSAAMIGFLALRSSPHLTELRWLPRVLAEWADAHGVVRNIPAFAVFHGLLLIALGWQRRRVALIGSGLFAAGVECAQLLLDGRFFGWDDIVASWTGVAAAHGLAWVIYCGLRRANHRTDSHGAP